MYFDYFTVSLLLWSLNGSEKEWDDMGEIEEPLREKRGRFFFLIF
jgi:hypothetical protein